MNFKVFESEMHKRYDFDIKYKNESLLMKLIGLILFFNPGFMTDFISTIGKTIYFPNKEFVEKNQQAAITTLAHEIVHVQQCKKYGKILFSLLYLFPQSLALLVLLTPISYLFLVFLVCLVPLPAPWRAKFEEEGYTMSLFMVNEELKTFQNTKDTIHDVLVSMAQKTDDVFFKGSAYWYMWPFGTKLKDKITDIENDVIVDTDETYNCARQSYSIAVSNYEK